MLKETNTGLVLVDVQGDLARIVHKSDELIANLQKLIHGCQILSIPIIWLEQYPKGLGKTVPELSNLLNEQKPFEKRTFNAIENLEIEQAISQMDRSQWLICGIEAHICVYQTAMGLLSKNYEVEVVIDCVSSRSKNNIELALKKLQQKGASMTSIEMCLYELIKDSKRDVFKKILPLIKN